MQHGSQIIDVSKKENKEETVLRQRKAKVTQIKTMVPKIRESEFSNENINIPLQEDPFEDKPQSSEYHKRKKHKNNDTNLNQGEVKDGSLDTGFGSSSDEELNLQDTVLIDKSYLKVVPGKEAKTENSILIALQVFFPFLIAGFGTVFAGLLLDVVQHWKIYIDIPEVYILVPALLGLKGNLEMTLASRLSTAANVGKMDCGKTKWKIIVGNMILTQAQALVVAVLASIVAVVFRWVASDKFSLDHTFLLCASALITASLASALLGSIMVAVIVVSRKYGINPDNVATPIAASLGDLVTLALLSFTGNFLYRKIELVDSPHHWISPFICVLCVILLPLWLYMSHHNEFTHDALSTGWWPVILAMCISSGGGLILSSIVRDNPGVAVFTPVINGVGGNLVAVQASRLSTFLHVNTPAMGTLPPNTRYGCINTFCTGGGHSRTARVLWAMCIPGHIVFLFIISKLKAGHTRPTLMFILIYLMAGFVQVGVLLFCCNWFVHWLWKRRKDPDNYSIPYLTALGDLLGTALLSAAFVLNDKMK